MFTWDSKGAVIAVTNRKLCGIPFLEQIERVADTHPDAIILREKDLSEEEYEKLAKEVMIICESKNVVCILHSFINVARKLNCRYIHVPLHILMENKEALCEFETVGVSIHSVEEAAMAQKLGASYITAGHIFETECKKGVPQRGITFLEKICESVDIPVFAIGGMSMDRMEAIRCAGAEGLCIMSGFMTMQL